MNIHKNLTEKGSNKFLPFFTETKGNFTTTFGMFYRKDGNKIEALIFGIKHFFHFALDFYKDGPSKVIFCKRCDKGFWY